MLLTVSVDDFLPAFIGASFPGAVRGFAAFAVVVTVLLIKISSEAMPLILFQPRKEALNPIYTEDTDTPDSKLLSQIREA
jgi:hypothetical protein